MSNTSLAYALPFFASLLFTVHCGSSDSPSAARSADDASTQAPSDAPQAAPELPLVPVPGKVDLLFVVDNSPSMADKQNALAAELDHLFQAMPVTDLHVGVISSSLGEGGDICAVDAAHPHGDDKAHLLNRGLDGNVIAGAENGFLSFGTGAISDYATLTDKTKSLITGVTERGCGFEAQLEAMYRFVSMPDPPASITSDGFGQAAYGDVDYDLLAQRKAFFRPDSTVAIVLLSDEDDGSLDPRSVGGFGYAFGRRNFPGSTVRRGTTAEGTTAPRASSECASDPLSSDCTSCGFAVTCDPQSASCAKLKSDPNCANPYYGPTEDDLNVRLFHMKQRFGVEPRYPVARYVAGLTSRLVPDRSGEHAETTSPNGQRMIAEYTQSMNCQNPLFASSLPEKAGDELCHLPDGPRAARQVFLGVLGGVPGSLLANGPDWTKILGANPDAYDFTGIDAHMLASTEPRPTLTGEWNTQGRDLQYACTFPLPQPRNCEVGSTSCECAGDPSGGTASKPPLCQADGSAVQVRGKAYPTTRELELAKLVGEQAVVGSLCDVDAAGGYAAFLGAFGSKVRSSLVK